MSVLENLVILMPIVKTQKARIHVIVEMVSQETEKHLVQVSLLEHVNADVG